MKYLFTFLLLILPVLVFADYEYNPYSGEWENAPDNSELKYNPYSGDWSYERPDSDLEYNPYSGDWEYER
tara:strand:- start:801 stop:1010 length:210 start_codon:yes stop_codon:yes gene_type:complete